MARRFTIAGRVAEALYASHSSVILAPERHDPSHEKDKCSEDRDPCILPWDEYSLERNKYSFERNE
jgi:hypothetical protein